MLTASRSYTQPLLWGLLHCLNDCLAGYMLAAASRSHHHTDSFFFIIVYSVIAFGGQLPVGFWLDYKKTIRPFALAAVLLLVFAAPVYVFSAAAGILVSAFASAFVHVTGGAVCLQAQEERTGPLALFTAPGVLGLTLGGLMGGMTQWVLLPVTLLTVAAGVLIFAGGLPALYRPPQKKASQLDAHDWLMLGILLVMCFRSLLFDVVNYLAHDYRQGILVAGISAFAGKIAGGFLADKIGWKKYVYISLPLALLLFFFGKHNIIALGFGIACLQGSVPITLMLMASSLPHYPATATALSLGTSVALAGLPLYLVSSRAAVTGWLDNGWLSGSFFVLLCIAWWVVTLLFNRRAAKPVAG